MPLSRARRVPYHTQMALVRTLELQSDLVAWIVVLSRFHAVYLRIIQEDHLSSVVDAALRPAYRDKLLSLLRFSRELLLQSFNRGSYPSVSVRPCHRSVRAGGSRRVKLTPHWLKRRRVHGHR